MISKQEAHGPHRSSEKTVQINKHIYIITLIKRIKITLLTLWEFIVFSFEEIESPSPKDALCQDWLKLAQWLWRREFFKFNVFSLFRNYLPLEKSRALHLNKLESPSPEDALCQVWLILARWYWRRRFLKVVNLFLLFPNYLPFGKGVAIHLNNLESPSPKDALSQVWLKLAQWFWRRRWKCEKFTDGRTDGRTDRQTTDDRW